jgi:hypothetical protein
MLGAQPASKLDIWWVEARNTPMIAPIP